MRIKLGIVQKTEVVVLWPLPGVGLVEEKLAPVCDAGTQF